MDPLTKQHFTSSMGWVLYATNDAISLNDREFAEKVFRELNGLTIKLAEKFDFRIRTGVVHKIENAKQV